MIPANLEEHDEVVLTGTRTDGVRFVNLRAVVSTISHKDEPAIEVWPVESDGKWWFYTKDIEHLLVVAEPS